jgi:hypothetical protein
MENKQQKKLFWDARIVIPFKVNKMKLNILVFEATKEQAENKAIEWSKKYVEDHYQPISKCIGYDAVIIGQPRVQVFKTGYATVI